MSQDIQIFAGEEHPGLSAAFLEVRLPKTDRHLIDMTKMCLLNAVRAEALRGEPISERELSKQIALTMELHQYDGVPVNEYEDVIGNCVSRIRDNLEIAIRGSERPDNKALYELPDVQQNIASPQPNLKYYFHGENPQTGKNGFFSLRFMHGDVPDEVVDLTKNIVERAMKDIFGTNANRHNLSSTFDSECVECPHGACVSIDFGALPDDGTNGSRTVRTLAAKVAVGIRELI